MLLVAYREGASAAMVNLRVDDAAPAIHIHATNEPGRGLEGEPGHAARTAVALYDAQAADVQDVGGFIESVSLSVRDRG